MPASPPVEPAATEVVSIHERIPPVSPERAALYDARFSELLERHGVLTAGVGVIRNGELVWTGYYGEQSPGVPASERTQFDVASITKTVAAETILRLAARGRLSLDEPMADHWLEDDIADSSHARAITPRMALTHSTGFPNWRFLDENNGWRFNPSLPLRFLFEPGTSYGYSGEGFDYVARFAERKLGEDFETLVRQTVFEPLGMNGASLSARAGNFANIVTARGDDGVFHGHYCRPSGWCREEGEWSAADDLRITVPDHARFLISAMNGEDLTPAFLRERNSVLVEKWSVPESILVMCEQLEEALCPDRQGYGLGWEVADYGDYQILSHGGSDWSEAAISYFYTDTRDGILIFLNAPNDRAIAMMPEALELVHPGSPIIPHYRHWAD
ncbi:beta-lactamase family protein [Parasphingopyxis algicola]|uniref:serine hydrolase domain-containing protein n=1 Tax=Parasphingopyxis algicola TaxID=2026624 RepID=UPI0015A2ECFF|nr:serine hydrolase domain-containing protein [Parasphingopyxis algicola]QLC26692.1 beta-lactamase family protein [Parasphingopyxis algicola]